MIMRNLSLTWLISISVILAAGCTTGSVNHQATSDDIAGTYTLKSVDGVRVPGRLSRLDGMYVVSGQFIIKADGKVQSSTHFRPPTGDEITRVVNATFSRKGDKLVMRWKGAGQTTGTIQDEIFTMDNKGMIFVYSRVEQVAVEPEQLRSSVSGQKARPWMFDDFNSSLVNGWDKHGNTIGYFTFVDSADSQSIISTTSDHPRRPAESDNNQVLELKLNVKAWAGVAHHFESADVDRWIAHDWRRFKSLSFWLYGHNSNTSLYVEFMDNRNPDSVTGAAELFTYTFTDNFSGWQLITVPFNEFMRKEIGNDAPNDGQGLAEVHGWAFGSLQTNGPITYYLDDFQLN